MILKFCFIVYILKISSTKNWCKNNEKNRLFLLSDCYVILLSITSIISNHLLLLYLSFTQHRIVRILCIRTGIWSRQTCIIGIVLATFNANTFARKTEECFWYQIRFLSQIFPSQMIAAVCTVHKSPRISWEPAKFICRQSSDFHHIGQHFGDCVCFMDEASYIVWNHK